LNIAPRKRRGEAGQAILLVVVAMSLFLLGAVGLAVDASQMYAQRQQAQAAADAAAIAGIYSIFNNYNSGTAGVSPHDFAAVGGTTYTCASSDARTPCYYAQTLNGFNKANDTVKYTPNPAGFSVPSLSSDPVNLLRVTVSRQVTTTLMKFLNSTNPNVTATATAAIVSAVSPIPIIITHPSNSGTFKGNGAITIKICGGPKRSIQVNSYDDTTQSVSGGANSVDLSQAGPGDPGTCTCTTACTGADFGSFGGPSPSAFNVSYGPKGQYVQPASPILDPLASVPVPAKPGTPGANITVAAGASTGTGVPNGYVTGNTVTCPSSTSPGGCDFYFPGDYATGLTSTGSNNHVSYFFPGLYYMDSGGFRDGPHGDMQMYAGATNPDTSATSTGSGMLVYNTGSGVFKVGSNGSASLVGSDTTSLYKGILLFQDRSAPAHITKNTDDHIIGGGGALSLHGTIYIHNSYSVMTSSHYQLLQLQGNGGGNTLIQGEIITNQLLLGGSGTITMNLNPNPTLPTRQLALVE
jgi:Flp pilus assembly protein TadG